MAVVPGTRVGAYEILSALGAGGMGEVYRARDPRLDRDVAIKILPDLLAADADRIARFRREAKTLASLNHPNIGGIHGIEESNGVIALVMELVDGEDLAARIARGAMPLDEALPIARQIADALEAAHEQGIVHRDLKPANIKVRPDGTVKVLDFGLAKAMDPTGSAPDLTRSPTMTTPAMTQAGIILGTAAYMSPEQARGRPLDKRTDIWAFGCVLYEMLTAQRVFAGDDVSDVLASVLAREPRFTALPVETPASIRRLLRRCLQKDRAQRLQGIGDARLEIDDAVAGVDREGGNGSAAPERRHAVERIAWAGAVTALALALIASWILRPQPPPAALETRVEVTTPPSAVPLSVAISPDGRTVAFVGTSDGQSRLWLRSLETGMSRVLIGTEAAEDPFWAPDSQSIGFFAAAKLKRVDVNGGSVQTLTNAQGGAGGTWSRDNVIVFASLGRPIARIPAAGGEPVPVEGLAQQGSDFSPSFLPDGRHFLYYLRGNPETRGVYLGRLDRPMGSRRLVDSDTGAVYAPSGYLLFGRARTLYAQSFDAARLELTGTPFQVAEHLPDDSGALSASRTGSIAYRTRTQDAQRQLAWFDRSGKELDRIGAPGSEGLADPSLSHDGQRVALYRGVNGNVDIWLVDTRRGVFSRFTSDASDDVYPVWSPDDSRIAFSSNRKGTHSLYVKSVAGGNEERVASAPELASATDWSHDGRFLLFTKQDAKGSFDIWAVDPDGKGKPFPVVETAFDEREGQFSPDGNWIAFQSNESGRAEIYVQPFPGPSNKWLISTSGGTQVHWRADGRELFYVAQDGRLMAVPVRLTSKTAAPDVGNPVPLFAPPLGGAPQQGDSRHQYMVSPDGQRILVATVTEEATAPIALILNWKPRP